MLGAYPSETPMPKAKLGSRSGSGAQCAAAAALVEVFDRLFQHRPHRRAAVFGYGSNRP
jgi:hypothetical protein